MASVPGPDRPGSMQTGSHPSLVKVIPPCSLAMACEHHQLFSPRLSSGVSGTPTLAFLPFCAAPRSLTRASTLTNRCCC